jgi:phosphatidylglycerol phospholipase C
MEVYAVDVHMSSDGVVVICHDALLKRLYGVDKAVTSLPWKDGLDQLRTIREPPSPMLRFRQLLEKVVSAEKANGATGTSTSWTDTWILMDIKVCYPRKDSFNS